MKSETVTGLGSMKNLHFFVAQMTPGTLGQADLHLNYMMGSTIGIEALRLAASLHIFADSSPSCQGYLEDLHGTLFFYNLH